MAERLEKVCTENQYKIQRDILGDGSYNDLDYIDSNPQQFFAAIRCRVYAAAKSGKLGHSALMIW